MVGLNLWPPRLLPVLLHETFVMLQESQLVIAWSYKSLAV